MYKIYNLFIYSFIGILLVSCSANENLQANQEKKQDLCKINLNSKLSYINDSPCINLPFGSISRLDMEKFENGQFNLKKYNVLDKENFFGMNYLDEGEVESGVVTRVAAKNNQIIVIVVNNNNMESEGYAQTYNIFSLDKLTGKLVGDPIYNIGFTKFIYDYDVTEYLFKRNSLINLESIVKLKDYDKKCVQDFSIDENYNLKTEYFCIKNNKKKDLEVKNYKIIFYNNNFKIVGI